MRRSVGCVIASMHFADLGAASKAIRLKAPQPSEVPGLRSARTGVAALFTKSPLPSLQPSRAGPDRVLGRRCRARPIPSRAPDRRCTIGWVASTAGTAAAPHGAWPGLDVDVPKSRNTEHSGLSAVMTLGRTKWTRIPVFLRTSAGAEAAAVDAPGKVWATALAKPPFFATCSVWESTDALMRYAYGGRGSASRRRSRRRSSQTLPPRVGIYPVSSI